MILVCDGCRDTNAEGLPFKESKFRSGIVDAEAAANYDAYKAKLRERACPRDGSKPALQVLELPSRNGFGFAVKAAMEHVRTPRVLVLQHDRPFTRRCNLPRLLAAMEADPDRLKYVGLPTSTTVGHQYHVLSKYGIRLTAFDADARGLQMLPLIQWYDSTHICDTAHYRDFVFGSRRLVVRGGFIEDKLGQAQLAAIRKQGFEAAHPDFGTFLACGEGFHLPVVAHLDGRDPMSDNKFRFNRGDDVQIAVDHAVESQEAEDLARSTKPGETASVGSAAARAAEAARIRAAEAMWPQAMPDAERGRTNGNGRIPEPKHGRPLVEQTRLFIPQVAKEAWQEYYIDNLVLKANTPGLGFRKSKNLDDRAPGDSSVPWGETVMGLDLTDGWVRVQSGRFLPTHLNGIRVLSVADGLHRDLAVSPPQHHSQYSHQSQSLQSQSLQSQSHQSQSHQLQPHQPQSHQPQSHQVQSHQVQPHQSQVHQSQTANTRPRQDVGGTSRGGTVRAPPLRSQMMPAPLMPQMPSWAPPLGPVPYHLPTGVPRPMGVPPMGAFMPPASAASSSPPPPTKPKAGGAQKSRLQRPPSVQQQVAQLVKMLPRNQGKAPSPSTSAKDTSPSPAPSHASPRDNDRMWEYIDPKGRTQGPFRTVEMQHWHNKGFFPKDLPIRCNPHDDFTSFEKMFPPSQVAFKNAPRRPPPWAG